MALRLIFPVLIALAMLFAPFAMRSGGAMASMPAQHGQAAADGHCSNQSAEDKVDKSSAKPCCAAMCAAIAVAPPAETERLAFANPLHRPALVRAGPSVLAKLPTPPPRFA